MAGGARDGALEGREKRAGRDRPISVATMTGSGESVALSASVLGAVRLMLSHVAQSGAKPCIPSTGAIVSSPGALW